VIQEVLMTRLHTTLMMSLTLALGFSCPVVAQEATTAPATEAPATDAPVPAAPAANDLSMGTEVGGGEPAAPPADGPGSQYVAASFDAWEQRCIRTEDGSDPCQLYQLLKDAEGNAVAEISMFDLPEGSEAAAGATIVAPLETLLTENLTMQIDGGAAKIYPFTWCSQLGCVARVGFTGAEVDQFRKGAKAVVTIIPVVAPDQKVALEISLKGFTAGYEAVKAANVADAASAPTPAPAPAPAP
jgi:invasion protein IalB